MTTTNGFPLSVVPERNGQNGHSTAFNALLDSRKEQAASVPTGNVIYLSPRRLAPIVTANLYLHYSCYRNYLLKMEDEKVIQISVQNRHDVQSIWFVLQVRGEAEQMILNEFNWIERTKASKADFMNYEVSVDHWLSGRYRGKGWIHAGWLLSEVEQEPNEAGNIIRLLSLLGLRR